MFDNIIGIFDNVHEIFDNGVKCKISIMSGIFDNVKSPKSPLDPGGPRGGYGGTPLSFVVSHY